MLNPLKPADSEASPWTIVTGLVDQIDFTGVLRPDCDIRMSGECGDGSLCPIDISYQDM